ncbi:MAG: hypothetical protein JXR21_04440, partial [Candidatus Marinimicrobia bacterium]|nr:hypothetical protein [Candidatus Neomarinimicrobiota bacterium]
REHSHIPGEFFNILFDGATFDEPFQMTEDLGVNLTAYAKGSAGYGTFIELPSFLGELRFGAAVNAYAGAFSHINITNLELVPTSENVTLQGTMEVMTFADTLSLFGEDGFQFHMVEDYLGIPQISMGYDFGLAWRFKLNRILPIMPKFIKNYIDIQVGVEDFLASISMNHAYLREISFEMDAGDLLTTFGGEGFSLDSMMVLSETLVYADSTISRPLGAKFHADLNYQLIPQLTLKGGWSTYITDGINAGTGPNYYYGAEIFPISSLSIFATAYQKNTLSYWDAGIRLYSEKSEFGLKARIYEPNFSLTENVSGVGIQLNWARYF